MALIYETTYFLVDAVDEPLVTRMDGGHIAILPKERIADRTLMSPEMAIEFIRLSMIVGEAMTIALNERGIDIGRINYQDNGNWGVFTPEGPFFHLHLYGRAKSAKFHKYGESCNFPFRNTGFYDGFQPLNADDIKAIKIQIEKISIREKYKLPHWGL
jgi:diadenosine tetraphosphate (Ap4A) HIT family hydrolase